MQTFSFFFLFIFYLEIQLSFSKSSIYNVYVRCDPTFYIGVAGFFFRNILPYSTMNSYSLFIYRTSLIYAQEHQKFGTGEAADPFIGQAKTNDTNKDWNN